MQSWPLAESGRGERDRHLTLWAGFSGRPVDPVSGRALDTPRPFRLSQFLIRF